MLWSFKTKFRSRNERIPSSLGDFDHEKLHIEAFYNRGIVNQLKKSKIRNIVQFKNSTFFLF